MQSLHRPPVSNLPNINPGNPYALFSLYISELDIQNIASSTNAYAELQISKNPAHNPRDWQSTTSAEIKVFFGQIIYMVVHKSPAIGDYWNKNDAQGPVHPSRFHIGQKQFEQIKRYIQISNPHRQNSSFIQVLEFSYSNFHTACQKYYKPGSNLSIDEMMIRFFGTMSTDTTSTGTTLFHVKFCQQLYLKLFEFSNPLPSTRSNPDSNHCQISLPFTQACAWCQFKRKRARENKGRAPRSRYGCAACNNIPLCLKRGCWKDFHSI